MNARVDPPHWFYHVPRKLLVFRDPESGELMGFPLKLLQSFSPSATEFGLSNSLPPIQLPVDLPPEPRRIH